MKTYVNNFIKILLLSYSEKQEGYVPFLSMPQNNNKANLEANQQSLNQEELLQTSEKFFGFMIFVAFTT